MATTSRKVKKQVKDTELVWSEKAINLKFYTVTYLHLQNIFILQTSEEYVKKEVLVRHQM